MSYTIFTSNPAALIAQPGRAVNTFPSGLVRVDQTYLGLTSQAAAHRATLAVGNDMPDGDSSPCLDGLKIFPEVQERRREDGFTEYIVSAYGRLNTSGQMLLRLELDDLYSVRLPTVKKTILYTDTTLADPLTGFRPTYTFKEPSLFRQIPANVTRLKFDFANIYQVELFGRFAWAYHLGAIRFAFIEPVLEPESPQIENFGTFEEAILRYAGTPLLWGGFEGTPIQMFDAAGALVGTTDDLFS